MKESLNNFVNYIIKQKKYSLNTAKNYEIDILEFESYINKKETNYLDVDYEFIKGYLMQLYNRKLSRTKKSKI